MGAPWPPGGKPRPGGWTAHSTARRPGPHPRHPASGHRADSEPALASNEIWGGLFTRSRAPVKLFCHHHAMHCQAWAGARAAPRGPAAAAGHAVL